MESSTISSAGSQPPQAVGLNGTGIKPAVSSQPPQANSMNASGMFEEKPTPGSQPLKSVGLNVAGLYEEKPTAASQPPQAVVTGVYEKPIAGSQPPQALGLTVTGMHEKMPTTLGLHVPLNPKEKRKREHEERVRMQQEAKREAQAAKRLKHEHLQRQQAEEKAKREQAAAQNRSKQQGMQDELAAKVREAKEAKVAAGQKLMEMHKLERRDRELREAVLVISPQSLSNALASTFQTYGPIESVKMDKFTSSFVIRFADKEAAQNALAQPHQIVEGGQLEVSISKQLVKAHCCFMAQTVSEDIKRNFAAYAEKLRPVMEAVGPVETIDIAKGHPVIMFKDMESAERAVAASPPLQMDGKTINFVLGLPKRVGSGDPQGN